MTNGRGKNKAKHHRRTKKTSKGIHGATRHPLSTTQKALLGKGLVQAFQEVPCPNPWRGAREESYPLFDKEQAEENRRLYPHLFDQF